MGMEMYQKLSRALMRRKYEKVGRTERGFEVKVRKPLTVKIPKSKGKSSTEAEVLEPLPVLVPKRFTILSSSNDVVDEAWLNQTLRRTLAEGRFNIIKVHPSEELADPR